MGEGSYRGAGPPLPRGAGAVPLLTLAAYGHPEVDVRRQALGALMRWYGESAPRYTRRELAAVLTAEEGTELEPFSLSRRDRLVAGFFLGAAFSDREGHTRFRVVSRSSLSPLGGLVVTRRLGSFYVERRPGGRQVKVSERVGFFAPRQLPLEGGRLVLPRPRTVAVIDGRALSLRVEGLAPGFLDGGPGAGSGKQDTGGSGVDGGSGSEVWERLRRHSRILGGDAQIPWGMIRVDWDAGGHTLTLRTTRSEAMVRLSALMARGSVMALAAGPEGEAPRFLVGLEPLRTERTELRCVRTFPDDVTPAWMRFPTTSPPEVKPKLRMALARWVGVLHTWIDDERPEELL